jgi:hypothetical protein
MLASGGVRLNEREVLFGGARVLSSNPLLRGYSMSVMLVTPIGSGVKVQSFAVSHGIHEQFRNGSRHPRKSPVVAVGASGEPSPACGRARRVFPPVAPRACRSASHSLWRCAAGCSYSDPHTVESGVLHPPVTGASPVECIRFSATCASVPASHSTADS